VIGELADPVLQGHARGRDQFRIALDAVERRDEADVRHPGAGVLEREPAALGQRACDRLHAAGGGAREQAAVLDFQPLGTVNTPMGLRSRVVVVAVRKEMVERAAAAVEGAGLEIEGIDLSAFGMVRALASEHEGAVLYVNVAGLTNVAVANAGGCLFTRASSRGVGSIAQALADRRGLTLEHARQWMGHVGLVAPLDGVEGDVDLVAATRSALEDGVRELADGIRTSLNFYRTQDAAETVELGVVTGPATSIPGFVEKLSDALRLPLEARVVENLGSEDAHRLTVAAGLAVAERP
jgi:type IV pilus assembly protein PilM